MKSAVEIAAALLLLFQLLSSFQTSSASTSMRGSGGVRNNDRRKARLRMLMQASQAKAQDKDDEDEDDNDKNDKDASPSPTVTPSTTTPSAYPSDVPSNMPTGAPVVEDPPLIIEADSNITENTVENDGPTIGDVEVVYSDTTTNLTATNATDANDEEEDQLVNQTVVEETFANSTMDVNVTGAPTTLNITESPTESPTQLMPCYWRFLTGESCTAHTNGDVISAYHHQYLLSDGDCHYNEFLGFYRARCEAKTDDEPARIWMTDVFCSDDSCGNCMQHGIVQPEIYKSHTCNYVRVNDFSRNTAFDFAFEFVGGCFANEACSRMTVAGHGK